MCKTHRQIHWLQENLLLPERCAQVLCDPSSLSALKTALWRKRYTPFIFKDSYLYRQRDIAQGPRERNKDTEIGNCRVCSGKRGYSNLVKHWCFRIISCHDGTGGERQMVLTWSVPCSRKPERLQFGWAEGTLCWSLVWVLFQLPANYVALCLSWVSEQL